ncbi:MAG: TolC family protein [Prevotella sp.]|nr:TolC family protein [Prevotella sp.]
MKRLLFVVIYLTAVLVVKAQGSRSMSVEEMFDLLEQNNSSLRVQNSGMEASQVGVEVAKRQRLPDIDAALSGNYLGNIVMTDRDFSNVKGYTAPRWANNFSLQVSQMIYSGGALTAGVRLAELQKEQSEQTTNLTREQLRFLVLGQYLDLYTLTNRQKVYESNIALTETLISDIKAKYEQGMALRNDITRYELQLATLQLGLRKVQDLFAIKNRELCVSLGIDEVTIKPDTTFIAQILQPDADIASAELSWQNEAQAFSPQIKLASIGTNIAEQNLKMTRSEVLPKLNFVAVDSFTGPITFEVPIIDQNLNVWYVGLGLSWSISSLYKNNKKVRKSKLELRQSQEQQTVVAENVGNAVYDAYTNYQQSFVELGTQTKSVKLAQENYQVIADRYLNQLSLITDMVDASNIRLNAELLEVDARINVIYSYYKMKYVSGTL